MEKTEAIHILWDYMCLHQIPQKADCIIGVGCYNEDVARRAAQLYLAGYAPRILFSGGLGRNTRTMWMQSEAERFARIAIEEGVPEDQILLEDNASNSGEHRVFSRRMLKDLVPFHPRILGVHKPYMERRLFAAFPVYWPEAEVQVTSWQQSFEEYVAGVHRWNRTEEDTIHMIVGDFRRLDIYVQRGYQVPQFIPCQVQEAFQALVNLGYTAQLIR